MGVLGSRKKSSEASITSCVFVAHHGQFKKDVADEIKMWGNVHT